MSLRDDLIEAGMEALADTDPPMEPPEYGIDDLAAACLDAFLDTLADRADEWSQEALWSENAVQTLDLIAVLRGDTE